MDERNMHLMTEMSGSEVELLPAKPKIGSDNERA